MSRQHMFVVVVGLVLGTCCALRDSSSSSAEDLLDQLDGVPEFSCPEMFGYYPAAGNCSIYFICDHGKATPKLCDDGLVFSTILKTCDWPYNVHCDPADGNRGDNNRKHLHLRLRTENANRLGEDEEEETAAAAKPAEGANNRRQPVFDDDSYWLGRPETSLLAVLTDEDDYIDRYHYVEPKRIAQPETRKPKKQVMRKPKVEKETSEEDTTSNGPWFERLNFDQARRGASTSTTAAAQQSPSPTTTTAAPSTAVASGNQRGSWRRRVKVVPVDEVTTIVEGLLPRRAARIEVDSPENDKIRPRGLATDAELTEELNSLRRRPTPLALGSPPATPRHLSSTVRRRVVRKKVSELTTTTSSKPTETTTARPASTLRSSWGTSAAWNFQRTPVTLAVTTPRPTTTRGGDDFGSFARKPVLRGVDDDIDSGNNNPDEDDTPGDAHFFLNPVEINKKKKESSSEEDNDGLPKNAAREVSNSVEERRNARRPTTSTPITTTTTRRQSITTTTTPAPAKPRPTARVSNENIFRAFDLGFHHAVRPAVANGNAAAVEPNGSLDMEYEEIDNEDEDENIDVEPDLPAEEPAVQPARGNNNNNKEIVVRYDDEEEETEGNEEGALPKVSTRVTPAPIVPVIPTRRLTQFVGLWVNNNNNNNDHLTVAAPRAVSPPAIHLTHLLPKNLTTNFRAAPALPARNTSFPFLPLFAPPPQPTFFKPIVPQGTLLEVKPKNVRQTGGVETVSIQKPKKNPKTKKIVKSNKPKVTKQYKPNTAAIDIPKIFHKGQYSRAQRCSPEVCRAPSCWCGGVNVPGGFSPKDIPQMIVLTFDDSVNDLNRAIYQRLFEQNRRNPNGCPIRGTFYVSHEWTDYSQVQNLYSNGHEIASHSISHSFGEKFSKERWLAEISGQRELIALYGGVNWRDVKGMRAPFLQTGGNNMFEMLKEANFSYDSSMPVYDIDPPFWPYTFDYALSHECMIEPCPTNSIPGLWEVPMVMWEDLRDGRCSMADGCFNPSDEQGVYEMVKKNFQRHYASSRAPFPAFFHSRWFLTEHNMNGFIKFLDEVLQQPDVYLVTNWQVIEWMRHPTPLSKIKSFEPFGCADIAQRPPQCKSPHTCKVAFRQETRTLRTCQPCPKTYPWTGNNGFQE